MSKVNELLEVLRFQGARIGLKINVTKTNSLRLEIVKMKRWHWITKRSNKWTASLTLVVLIIMMVGAVKKLKVE